MTEPTSVSNLNFTELQANDRGLAIQLAWNGYTRLPETVSSAPSLLGWLLILAGGGSLSHHFYISVIFFLLAAFCFYSASYNKRVALTNKRANETATQLQAAGHRYLEGNYEQFVATGRRSLEESIRSLKKAGEISWTSILSTPVQTQMQGAEPFVSPTFLKPRRLYLSGCAISKNSLLFVPDTIAKVKANSFVASILSGPGPDHRSVLHLYDMALEAAKNNLDANNCPILLTRNLSFSEIFLTELVSVSHTKTGPTTSDLSLTARDGRMLELEVDPPTAEAIRHATSYTKANIG